MLLAIYFSNQDGVSVSALTDLVPEDFGGDVHVLTSETFDDFVLANKHILVQFYAPWCGHCKRLKPVWEQLGTKLKDHPRIMIAEADCTVETVLCERQQVRSYPTIKYWAQQATSNGWGTNWMERPLAPSITGVTAQTAADQKYTGGREYDSLLEFAMKLAADGTEDGE